jgi:hypothetical protein
VDDPGVIVSTLVPRFATLELIFALVPWVSVTTAITAPTPTITPSIVSNERKRFAQSASKALEKPIPSSNPRRRRVRRWVVARPDLATWSGSEAPADAAGGEPAVREASIWLIVAPPGPPL